MKLGFVVVASVAAFTFKNVNGGARRNKGTTLVLQFICSVCLFEFLTHEFRFQTMAKQGKGRIKLTILSMYVHIFLIMIC